MQEPSKDYIREFGTDQEQRKLPITFNPQDDWDFEKPINHLPTTTVERPEDPGQDEQQFASEGSQTSITEKELKEMVSSAVLHMMNAPTTPYDTSLLENQKQEIEKIIAGYWDRPGLMSICFHENAEKDEASVGMLIDPTNTQNWVFLKEETIYKLPYAFKDSLHSYASEVWKKRNLVMEAELPNTEQIQSLKQQISAAHKEADARYNEVAHQSNGYSIGNIFEPSRQSFPNQEEGHRNALADNQYRALKKKAIDLETKLRRLEKQLRIKK